MHVVARAPGRVNLIGDHTDYVEGLAVPMAIQLETQVRGEVRGDRVRLRSEGFEGTAAVELDVAEPREVQPPWARYVAGVVAELRPRLGLTGVVSSTLPPGSGLSSSAALEVALALALGGPVDPLELARRCQAAELRASGVPCGLMDQLTATSGRAGHALLMDFRSLGIEPVAVPECQIAVVHSGEPRALATSAYAERRAQCEAAARRVGPLRDATLDDLAAIGDEMVARRARHVVTENARVLAFAAALGEGDLGTAGGLMSESHRSLARDFEVSTPALDALVARLGASPGVFGARLTGAGFGGCVVALAEPGALAEGWTVTPADGASVRWSDARGEPTTTSG